MRRGDTGASRALAEPIALQPGARKLVPTGLRMEIPIGWEGPIRPRSGLAAKHGISIVNTPGLVDSGYRGELLVNLVNHDEAQSFVVEPGMRIAQLVILQVPPVELVEVEELPDSERGADGFGSSG